MPRRMYSPHEWSECVPPPAASGRGGEGHEGGGCTPGSAAPLHPNSALSRPPLRSRRCKRQPLTPKPHPPYRGTGALWIPSEREAWGRAPVRRWGGGGGGLDGPGGPPLAGAFPNGGFGDCQLHPAPGGRSGLSRDRPLPGGWPSRGGGGRALPAGGHMCAVRHPPVITQPCDRCRPGDPPPKKGGTPHHPRRPGGPHVAGGGGGGGPKVLAKRHDPGPRRALLGGGGGARGHGAGLCAVGGAHWPLATWGGGGVWAVHFATCGRWLPLRTHEANGTTTAVGPSRG